MGSMRAAGPPSRDDQDHRGNVWASTTNFSW